MATDFESFLIGRLSAAEDAARTREAPQAETVSASQPEPTQAEKDKYFMDHLEEIAGVKPTPGAPKAEEPPATLSRQAPNYQRQFAKLAEAIATGKTTIVD